MINFGVGNYGIDQALLRMKREYPKNKTDSVILAIVPETISRIVSIWKHYYEYGNTFGFKPRFILKNNQLQLIQNPIDNELKFFKYEIYSKKIIFKCLLFVYSLGMKIETQEKIFTLFGALFQLG